ncbi:MAG: ABC transporter permease [Lachnospiraceae bacterium]|nr:ABC transporter permease [Lachnospiraceae bacterium]
MIYQKLFARIPRQLRARPIKYTSLVLILAIGVYMVCAASIGVDTMYVQTLKTAEESRIQDGAFSLFVPLTDTQKQEITALDIELEETFYFDQTLDDGDVLRIFKVRDSINTLALASGTLPEGEKEIALEIMYARAHGYEPGDTIYINGEEYTVSAVCCVPDYNVPVRTVADTTVDEEHFSVAFLSQEGFKTLLESWGGTPVFSYAYRLGENSDHEDLRELLSGMEFDPDQVEDPYYHKFIDDALASEQELLDGLEEVLGNVSQLEESTSLFSEELALGARAVYEGIDEVYSSIDETLQEQKSTVSIHPATFVRTQDDPRILASAERAAAYRSIGWILGILILLLISYILAVYTGQEVTRDMDQIGALLAMGLKRGEILLHYMTMPMLLSFLGGCVGFLVSLEVKAVDVYAVMEKSFSVLPQERQVLLPYLVVGSLLLPPLIATVVNFCSLRKQLKRPALELLHKEQDTGRIRRFPLPERMPFLYKFQLRQIIREGRNYLIVLMGVFISATIILLALDLYFFAQNCLAGVQEDLTYNYMYLMKYPVTEVPEGGEGCCYMSLQGQIYGKNSTVNILGIELDNSYFPAETASGVGNLCVSSALAEKYDLSVGDDLILTDLSDQTRYLFTVSSICDYNVGLMAFMDIDSMRELFGLQENAYQAVVSGEALPFEDGQLTTTVIKEDLLKMAQNRVDELTPIACFIAACGVLVFLLLMYFLTTVLLDHSAYGISLTRIFGYTPKEISKLYLDANVYIILLSILITLPVSTVLVRIMVRYTTASWDTGLDTTIPWYIYALMVVITLASYWIVHLFLKRKTNNYSLMEALTSGRDIS